MNFRNVALLSVSLFLLAGFGVFSIPASFGNANEISMLSPTAPQSPPTYLVHHETYFSVYGDYNFSGTTTIFYVSLGVTYANSSFVFPSNPDTAVNITADGSLVFHTFSVGQSQLSGKANISISQNGQIFVQSPAQLIGVVVSQNGTQEEVWSGYLSTNNTVSGFAYYNSNLAGNITLEYASSSSTMNFTAPFAALQTSYQMPVSGVTSLKSVGNLTSSTSFTVPVHFPQRYHPIASELNLTKFNLSKIWQEESHSSAISYDIQASENNATTAYLNDTMYPSLVWKLTGDVAGNSSIGGNNVSTGIPFQAEAIAFYGVNGVKAGYVLSLFAAGSISSSSQFESGKLTFTASSTTTAIGYDIAPAGNVVAQSNVKVNGASVLVFLTSNGQIESTANVTYTRSVYLNSGGSLAQLQVNSTASYYAIFSNGNSGNVNVVTPLSDSNSTYSINGTSHVSQTLEVNGSGYILINATVSGNYEGTLYVYKSTPQGNVQLNASNYAVSKGHIQIFDDPSSTYYVVYSQTTQGSNNFLYVISGIIILVVIAASVLLAVRRRKSSKSQG